MTARAKPHFLSPWGRDILASVLFAALMIGMVWAGDMVGEALHWLLWR